MITAVSALGKAGLVDELRDHHQPHPAQWQEPAASIDAGNRAAGLVALQTAIVNLNLQPVVGADTADIDAQAGYMPSCHARSR